MGAGDWRKVHIGRVQASIDKQPITNNQVGGKTTSFYVWEKRYPPTSCDWDQG